MAGAGFKTFNTGDVLTASDVNTYLMQQTVMVFDDASARSTALPTPSEGMFSYLKDTNLTYRYDGSAWLSDAGTTSPLTTKGDVWGYSTADARIPVGANGTVLTADSAEALGVKWAAPAGGKVLQVVSATTTTATAIASTTLTDTGITATITPTAATSKILIILTGQVYYSRVTTLQSIKARFFRGATQLADWPTNSFAYLEVAGATEVANMITPSFSYLDSPATTSATTYKLQAAVNSTANSGSSTWQYSSTPSTITLLEIGA